MLRRITRGVAAGACGTVAIDMATYADMLIRGRPASGVPTNVAQALTDRSGISLGSDETDVDRQKRDSRQSALGSLLGFADGLGVGIAYALLEPRLRDLPRPLVAAGVGAVAMAGSDIPSVAVGATDPKTWGVSGWLADIVPHLLYGLVTVAAFDLFADRDGRRT